MYEAPYTLMEHPHSPLMLPHQCHIQERLPCGARLLQTVRSHIAGRQITLATAPVPCGLRLQARRVVKQRVGFSALNLVDRVLFLDICCVMYPWPSTQPHPACSPGKHLGTH